jgi:hypothetical protein
MGSWRLTFTGPSAWEAQYEASGLERRSGRGFEKFAS